MKEKNEELGNKILNLQQNAIEMEEKFYTGNINDGIKIFQVCINYLDDILVGLKCISEEIYIDEVTEVNRWMLKLESAFINKDYILLTDIFNYEIMCRIKKIGKSLN